MQPLGHQRPRQAEHCSCHAGSKPYGEFVSWTNVTYRDADDRRIEGTWRHVFIKNGGTFYLTNLKIYADGMIDCWGLVDLQGFREKLRTGWVATAIPNGGRAAGHDLAFWTFSNVKYCVDPDDLYTEVADEIARLAGRPTTSQLCVDAAERYCSTHGERDRTALMDAYLAVPEHHRRAVLGDMDAKDWPIRALLTPAGETLLGSAADFEHKITADDRTEAFSYFERRARQAERSAAASIADGPPSGEPGSVEIAQQHLATGSASSAGLLALRNEFESQIEVNGESFQSVAHGYWAAAVADTSMRQELIAEPNSFRVRKIALEAGLRDGWSQHRLPTMKLLLDAKFRQHRDIAEILASTGERAILYNEALQPFWSAKGRNWMGRLLELVRAELLSVKTSDGD